MSLGMKIGTASMENSMEIPQKIKTTAPIGPGNLSSGYLPEKIENTYL